MKRFLLFYGHSYYANGGWADFRGDFETLDKATRAGIAAMSATYSDWLHVIDTETRRVVAYINGGYCGDVDQVDGFDDAVNLDLETP